MSDEGFGVTGGEDEENDVLLAELRAWAALYDPAPPDAVAAARSAIAWRSMDAELAELTAESAVEPELAGVRSGSVPTLLTFEAGDLTVELEVLEQPDGRRRLQGQLVPPTSAALEIRHSTGVASIDADDVGRFAADGIGAGPLSLRCEVEGHVVETDWFLA
jgi:hypothetical protein